MDNTTRQLVEYARGLRYEDLSPATVTHCKHSLLDTLGCIAAAYDHPLSAAARGLAGRYGCDTPATILGSGQRAAPEMAAFANGVMLRLLDLSDMYRVKSGGHPSDVIAALLAAAEVGRCSGKSLITAIAAAYEIYCACCQAIDLNSAGWDQPVYGIVAAALGSGKLLGLTAGEMANAVALSIVPNMTLYQTRRGELSNWKGCAGANASRNALFAVWLAKAGFTGPDAPFEGEAGVWPVVGEFDWAGRLREGAPVIAETHLKAFPLCYHGQSAVWAALELRPRVALDRIDRIRIGAYRNARDIMANHPSRWAPQSPETADHSLPYVVAVALIDGRVGHESFDEARLGDPALTALMVRTDVEEQPDLTALYPESSPCRLTVRMQDGHEVNSEVRYPKGHAMNPLSEGEIEAKFKDLFGGFAGERQAERLIGIVHELDRLQDVGKLIEGFARQAQPAHSGAM